nr:Odorant-binding protein A10 [Metisa plana]
MKIFVGVLLLATAASASSSEKQENTLSLEYFLSSVDCFLDVKPCSPDVKLFRDHIVDLLESHCEKCSKEEVKSIRMIDDILAKDHKQLREKLYAKYDPESKFRGPFRKYLEENSR